MTNARVEPPPAPRPPRVRVIFGPDAANPRVLEFDRAFRIGRADDCEVCIKDEYVSRVHVSVEPDSDQWRVRDLGSANGIFLDGQRVPGALIDRMLRVRLGVGGPFVSFEVQQPPPPPPQPAPPSTASRSVDRYFAAPTAGDDVGDHTRMVRIAFHEIQKKQKRKYGGIMAALGVVLLIAAGWSFYLYRQNSQQRALAQELFYSMKSLDVDIANVEKLVMDVNNPQGLEQIKKYQDRRRSTEQNYDKFLSSLNIYNKKLSPEDKLILRVARIFGECELDVPPGFTAEVQNYIKKWQSSARYRKAIQLAKEKGYDRAIANDFLAQDLPPQFFYLAMQESDFDQYISGPPTYKGIAKGMWQFIPETAAKYGLHVGPLADLRRPDPGDDRHHWELATKAAARYIKDIYSTDAQASGLLVIASYNWGEDKVIKLIRSMPANPKDRNFWKLMEKYPDKIPHETYDYVYYIFSAAVIGENPRMFGFDFDNPLAHLESK